MAERRGGRFKSAPPFCVKGEEFMKGLFDNGKPAARRMSQLVAAQVRERVEAAVRKENEAEVNRITRREHLREVYRRHVPEGGEVVDFAQLREMIEDVTARTFVAWKRLAQMDAIAIAQSAGREEFSDLEFLLYRGMSEMNGMKNILTMAKRMA